MNTESQAVDSVFAACGADPGCESPIVSMSYVLEEKACNLKYKSQAEGGTEWQSACLIHRQGSNPGFRDHTEQNPKNKTDMVAHLSSATHISAKQ